MTPPLFQETDAPLLVLNVAGTPVATPRARRGARPGTMYTPKTADGWKNLISLHASSRKVKAPLQGAIKLCVVVWMPRTSKATRHKPLEQHELPHTQKPDGDNLIKAIKDALTDAGVWNDDCQVSDERIRKRWIPVGGTPGASIVISRDLGDEIA